MKIKFKAYFYLDQIFKKWTKNFAEHFKKTIYAKHNPMRMEWKSTSKHIFTLIKFLRNELRTLPNTLKKKIKKKNQNQIPMEWKSTSKHIFTLIKFLRNELRTLPNT
jgi:hypothetical protein